MKKPTRILFVAFTVLFLFFFLAATYYSLDKPQLIRVRVDDGKDKISLRVRGPYKIEAINSDRVLEKGRYLRRTYITPTESGIRLGEKKLKIYGIRVIPKRDGSIYVDRNRFRGIIDIIRTEGLKLTVINHLDMEKYLYGVLYREAPYHWPMEMLKAQAIAARTFALHRKESTRDKDYDVTDDIYSQVYGGLSREKWRTTRAVNATKGKVLTYEGKLFPAYYHSICGGHTEDAKAVFEMDLPPLRGRRCPYCKGGRNMNWKAVLSYREMEEKLNAYGIKVKGMSYILARKRGRSGRLESIKVLDTEGAKNIKAYKFRLALGPNTIKSTNFTVKITPKGVLFRGKGWGHGVGMCQWGGYGMSRRRFNHKQILSYYYPGAKLE
jgi:stage II sporulation protein D